jgi:hypothetical protein
MAWPLVTVSLSRGQWGGTLTVNALNGIPVRGVLSHRRGIPGPDLASIRLSRVRGPGVDRARGDPDWPCRRGRPAVSRDTPRQRSCRPQEERP